MNDKIEVTAKNTGYHPASGHHLVEGGTYTINVSEWAEEIFERPDPCWLSPDELKLIQAADKGGIE